jgi:uncharacterized protein
VKPPGAREPLIDALRAFALLGVVAVNLQSYRTGPWGSPLPTPAPDDSPLASAVFVLIAWLLQGKAYPLLAFLFGYSQALALRGRSRDAARRRLWRMLVLGLLHGVLLFAGDVLTVYALVGMVLLAQSRARLCTLIGRLRLWTALALAAFALNFWFVSLPGDGLAPPSYPQVRSIAELVALNADAYLVTVTGGALFFGPEVLMLMLAGFIAGRIGLLTRRRWRGRVARFARFVLPLGLAANAAYAAAALAASDANRPWPGLVGPLGWLLAAGFAAALATAWHAGPPALLRAIVPLGRYTLSLYVGVSLIGALLLSGTGLRWPLGTTGLAVLALLVWSSAAVAAQRAAALGWRGPLEVWMARR